MIQLTTFILIASFALWIVSLGLRISSRSGKSLRARSVRKVTGMFMLSAATFLLGVGLALIDVISGHVSLNVALAALLGVVSFVVLRASIAEKQKLDNNSDIR